jgi:hypothetical protein
MGFLSKVFKAPLQVVDTIAEVSTDIVKAPIQVTEDLYQGVRDIGDTAVNVVEGIGSGAQAAFSGIGQGIGSIGSDPVFLAGTAATGSVAGGGMAALQQQQFRNQLEYMRSISGGLQPGTNESYARTIALPGTSIPQLSLSLPNNQPMLPSAKVQSFNLPLILGLAAGAIVLAIFLMRGNK